jgi:hypothetical protein
VGADVCPRCLFGEFHTHRLAHRLGFGLFLTEVDQQVQADTYFPALDPGRWKEVARTPAKESAGVSFIDLERIGATT